MGSLILHLMLIHAKVLILYVFLNILFYSISERRRPVMDVSKLRGIIWMWNIGCLSTADVSIRI